jgi:hypothetical protein
VDLNGKSFYVPISPNLNFLPVLCFGMESYDMGNSPVVVSLFGHPHSSRIETKLFL